MLGLFKVFDFPKAQNLLAVSFFYNFFIRVRSLLYIHLCNHLFFFFTSSSSLFFMLPSHVFDGIFLPFKQSVPSKSQYLSNITSYMWSPLNRGSIGIYPKGAHTPNRFVHVLPFMGTYTLLRGLLLAVSMGQFSYGLGMEM